jgi:hypothetical protein
MVNLDASAFYTYFSNKIVGDFDSDPNKSSMTIFTDTEFREELP